MRLSTASHLHHVSCLSSTRTETTLLVIMFPKFVTFIKAPNMSTLSPIMCCAHSLKLSKVLSTTCDGVMHSLCALCELDNCQTDEDICYAAGGVTKYSVAMISSVISWRAFPAMFTKWNDCFILFDIPTEKHANCSRMYSLNVALRQRPIF
jgi:hypothetical protein